MGQIPTHFPLLLCRDLAHLLLLLLRAQDLAHQARLLLLLLLPPLVPCVLRVCWLTAELC
jgi:hypothetical protein